MRAVLQRVSAARVLVDGTACGAIGRGLLCYAACACGDTDEDFAWIAGKVADLRLFPGEDSHFSRSLKEIGGPVLAISQFTLLGDARKGRRPSFSDAMPVEEARAAFDRFLAALRATGVPVETGRFQASMQVESVNDGPVTLLLDSRKRF